MKVIELNKGHVAIVDDEDFEKIAQYHWTYVGKGYAHRNANGKSVYMHRVVMNTPDGFDTDHINGNRLDNRKCNLRIVTHKQNLRNTAVTKRNKLGVKGVWFWKKRNKYVADIGHEGKTIHLGTFKTPEEAKTARNEAVLKYHGDFARSN
jgi:hypothetical protein